MIYIVFPNEDKESTIARLNDQIGMYNENFMTKLKYNENFMTKLTCIMKTSCKEYIWDLTTNMFL